MSSNNRNTVRSTYLIDDMRLLVSFVNWHLTLLLEHSEQLVVSVASHYATSYLTKAT